jgi:hypothetical protein
VLKALANPATLGTAAAALSNGRPFTMERFGVLVADARSIVLLLNAQELRGRLDKSKDLNAETRQWIDQDIRVIDACGSERFANRGGRPVLERTVAMVGKHRNELQALLFQSSQLQTSRFPTDRSNAPNGNQ